MRKLNLNKYLSHRLRGFDKYEYTIKAVKNAIKANIPYLEIDTRVSKDNVLYVYHDPEYNSVSNKKINISKTTSSAINSNKYCNNYNIMTLDEFLKIFTQRDNKNQTLCIDIKDYGYEKEHLELVEKYNLESNIVWVSWIPQTLIAMDKISPDSKKVLSCLNLFNYSILGKFLENIPIFKLIFTHIVFIGKNLYSSDLNNYKKGFQHCYIAQQFPNELIDILSKNSGAICIPKKILSKNLIDYCKKNNIKIWIFSVKDYKEYKEYLNQNIEVIFVDDKPY